MEEHPAESMNMVVEVAIQMGSVAMGKDRRTLEGYGAYWSCGDETCDCVHYLQHDTYVHNPGPKNNRTSQ